MAERELVANQTDLPLPTLAAADCTVSLTALKSTLALLDKLHKAHHQRVAEYRLLDTCFSQYISKGNEASYREQLASSTGVFQGCSSDVRAIIDELETGVANKELAELLRKLQKVEQSKLRFTLILQALKKAESAGRFSWQQSTGKYHQNAGFSDECGCCSAVPEPTQEEFQNATAEAVQELQAVTVQINDILYEIQDIEEDFREQTTGLQ